MLVCGSKVWRMEVSFVVVERRISHRSVAGVVTSFYRGLEHSTSNMSLIWQWSLELLAMACRDLDCTELGIVFCFWLFLKPSEITRWRDLNWSALHISGTLWLLYGANKKSKKDQRPHVATSGTLAEERCATSECSRTQSLGAKVARSTLGKKMISISRSKRSQRHWNNFSGFFHLLIDVFRRFLQANIAKLRKGNYWTSLRTFIVLDPEK